MIELMIASLIGTMIATAVYNVFVKSSAYYSQQIEHTQAQSSTRFAMEFLKAELRDLGRLSVLNTNRIFRDPLYCGIRIYEGVSLKDNDRGGDGYEPSPAHIRNDVYPDRLRLLIDASDATPIKVSRQAGVTLDISPAKLQPMESARRLLSLGAEGRFASLFDEQSLVRITNLETGRYDIMPTQFASLQNEQGRITLEDPPCSALNCNSGNCIVNPIHWVEYAVLHHPQAPEHSYFMRRRLQIDSALPIEDSQLMLADHVVDFQVWGDFDTRGKDHRAPVVNAEALLPMIPQDPKMKDDRGNWDPTTPESHMFIEWSHRLRGLNLLLSTRGARVDPALTFVQNLAESGPQERVSYKIESAKESGLAHVSTLIGSVETPNLYRGD
jgi:hypothetical protein